MIVAEASFAGEAADCANPAAAAQAARAESAAALPATVESRQDAAPTREKSITLSSSHRIR
jgi:hypothetical protein